MDDEGTVFDIVVQSRRNKKAAKRLLRKLLKNNGVKPERIVTDLLRSYSAALKDLNMQSIHDVGGERTIEPKTLISQSGEGREKRKGSDQLALRRNNYPATVKSTICLTSNVI